mgnify:CR=1 FL=1
MSEPVEFGGISKRITGIWAYFISSVTKRRSKKTKAAWQLVCLFPRIGEWIQLDFFHQSKTDYEARYRTKKRSEGEDTTDQVAGSYPLRLAFLTFLSPSRPTNTHILNHMRLYLFFLIPSLHSHILMSLMQSIMAEEELRLKEGHFPDLITTVYSSF